MKWLAFLLFCQTVATCEIRVAAAANLAQVMPEIGQEFERLHPDCSLTVTLGSSGKLAAQILNGAPYDVFLSADLKRVQTVCDDGYCQGEIKVYAKGKLLLLSLKPSLLSSGVQSLSSSQVNRIALANPRLAPYGKAAMEVLKAHGLYKELQEKLVFGESVGQALQFTMQAADAGFVAASSLYSNDLKSYRSPKYLVWPSSEMHSPLQQGGVVLKNADRQAQGFFDFLLSGRVQAILQASGYEEVR